MHTDSWICLPAAETETGAALRFAAERLMTRAEDLKLLFLISDGQPAGDGYYGTAAEADLRGIKQEYSRKGFSFLPPQSEMTSLILNAFMEMVF